MPAGQTDQGETRSASDHTLCWSSLPPGPTPPTTQLSRLEPSVLRGSPPTPAAQHPPTLATSVSPPVPAHWTWPCEDLLSLAHDKAPFSLFISSYSTKM